MLSRKKRFKKTSADYDICGVTVDYDTSEMGENSFDEEKFERKCYMELVTERMKLGLSFPRFEYAFERNSSINVDLKVWKRFTCHLLR